MGDFCLLMVVLLNRKTSVVHYYVEIFFLDRVALGVYSKLVVLDGGIERGKRKQDVPLPWYASSNLRSSAGAIGRCCDKSCTASLRYGKREQLKRPQQ